jgi:putative hydrolase of the HAD superfamily
MIDIRAVLFDYGMVLSGPPSPSAWARMLAVTSRDDAPFHAAYWEHRHAYDRGTFTGRAYWHAVGTLLGQSLDAAQVDALIAADNDLWTELNPPMVAWAEQLHRAGVRTGILSNMGDEMSSGVLRKFPWLSNFHHCTWSHAVKLAKPELAIYHHAAAGLNTPFNRILFLDDREENIAAAAQLGMQTLHYTIHRTFEQEMTARGLHSLLHPTIP